MDILDDMGVSKLSAKVVFFFKVNYSFKRRSLFYADFNLRLRPLHRPSMDHEMHFTQKNGKQLINSKLIFAGFCKFTISDLDC